MRRNVLLKSLSAALGRRRLIWAGLRTDDAKALEDLPNLEASFSILGASGSMDGQLAGLAFEQLSNRRPDLEVWDVQDHLETAAGAVYRRALLDTLAAESALLPYRPSQFLSSAAFARRHSCLDLGMFSGLQAAFEHKPWVECELRALGVQGVPWIYVADQDAETLAPLLQQGPLMLRRARTSGGEGLVQVHDSAQLRADWPRDPDALISVAPYLQDALPLNVGGVVWHDGVTVHDASVQLIGLPSCVMRQFGYCGNDFGAVRDVDAAHLDEVEAAARLIGEWMRRRGYRGAYGLDFVIHEGRALFMEINPRFQGSSALSAVIARGRGQSCVFSEHIAAVLGFDAPAERSAPLRLRAREAPTLAQFIVHSAQQDATGADAAALVNALRPQVGAAEFDLVASPSTALDPNAVLVRVTAQERVTMTGFDLSLPLATIIDGWRTSVESAQWSREPASP